MDDIGIFALETSKDLYHKMKHDFGILTQEQTSYTYFNFIIDANHLIEWIEKDTNLSDDVIRRATTIKNLCSYKLINDMANRGKHFIRKEYIRKQQISKDELIPELNFDHIDFSKINFGGPVFVVEYQGEEVNLYTECQNVFKFYEQLFE